MISGFSRLLVVVRGSGRDVANLPFAKALTTDILICIPEGVGCRLAHLIWYTGNNETEGVIARDILHDFFDSADLVFALT